MKNIVLFCDGTGNSSRSRDKTNVWRMYRALNQHRPSKQVCTYGDGVGTSEFKPFKVLGGALGFGLKRDVIELYKYLCQNYEDGDRIYLFGFSRGGFTVRLLAGIIAKYGVYKQYDDFDELEKQAGLMFRRYRFECGETKGAPKSEPKLFRGGRGLLFKLLKPFSQFEDVEVLRPDIEFIGVWDTVDAYGLPIDELTLAWDFFIYPLRFPDQNLNPKIKKACHAVSVDDERHTFHPVLWNEEHEKDDRIEQVWFSGVHADIGGGYSMGDLSLVSLEWMVSKVDQSQNGGKGLHFIDSVRDELAASSNWHGVHHDSRAGFAAYYRYKPRDIDALCNDHEKGVFIKTPKIHQSVFRRIKQKVVPYAPTALPETYEMYGGKDDFETDAEKTARNDALEYARDTIYWRRWVYVALVLTTLYLAAFPWLPYGEAPSGGTCEGSACLLAPIFDGLARFLPDFLGPWLNALKLNAVAQHGFIAAFVLLVLLQVWLAKRTRQQAYAAWAALKGRGAPPKWTPTWTSKLRSCFKLSTKIFYKWIVSALFLIAVGCGMYWGLVALYQHFVTTVLNA